VKESSPAAQAFYVRLDRIAADLGQFLAALRPLRFARRGGSVLLPLRYAY
jgi:hypothetical protein